MPHFSENNSKTGNAATKFHENICGQNIGISNFSANLDFAKFARFSEEMYIYSSFRVKVLLKVDKNSKLIMRLLFILMSCKTYVVDAYAISCLYMST